MKFIKLLKQKCLIISVCERINDSIKPSIANLTNASGVRNKVVLWVLEPHHLHFNLGSGTWLERRISENYVIAWFPSNPCFLTSLIGLRDSSALGEIHIYTYCLVTLYIDMSINKLPKFHVHEKKSWSAPELYLFFNGLYVCKRLH